MSSKTKKKPSSSDGAKKACKHVFHGPCVASLRVRADAQVCPLCRKDLPPGPDVLYEKAIGIIGALANKVKRGLTSWLSLNRIDGERLVVPSKCCKKPRLRGTLVHNKNWVSCMPMARACTFDFCLSTSIPVLTTSTYVVAWPQGDQFRTDPGYGISVPGDASKP